MNTKRLVKALVEAYIDDEIRAEIDRVLGQEPDTLRRNSLIQKILTGSARESQYTDALLATNSKLGDGNGLTILTFLNKRLTGRARTYSGDYSAALERSLKRRVGLGLARIGVSKGGGVAYYPETDQVDTYKSDFNIESPAK